MNSQDQKQIKSQYEKQKNDQWKTLTAPLTQDAKLHSQLNNFITIIYQKFRRLKSLPQDFKPTIKFQGFKGFQDFPEQTKMGHCHSRLTWKDLDGQKVAGSESGWLSIALSQKLLLSKLGMPELITEYHEDSRGIRWSKLAVGFEELIETIAHEIAHGYQFLVNEDEVKSQCESTGERDYQGQLKYPQLALEHTKLTSEIQTMTVKLPEYQKFKNWWEGKETTENILENILEEAKEEKLAVEVNSKTSNISPEPTEKTVESSSQKSDWPAWVLPVGIIVGVFLLGIIYQIFKKKR